MSIYRFRPINRILSNEDLGIYKGCNDELRRQEIYFSSLDGLNDPMEGFKDIKWQGDEIVWKNLIKHYVMCLDHVCTLAILGKNDLESCNIPIYKKNSDFPNNYSNILKPIYDLLFSDQEVLKYPYFLSERKNPIRRNELIFYLKTLHFHILHSIYTIYYQKGLVEKIPFINKRKLLDENYFANLLKVEQDDKYNGHDVARILADIVDNIGKESEIIIKYNNRHTLEQHKNFLLIDFPDLYLKEIDKLLYPEFFIACFSTNCNNSSMWSHYAENHEGICLQFKTTGKNKFELFTQESRKIVCDIYQVNYQQKFPEIDFFQSLGAIPIPHLYEMWLYDQESKNTSGCAGFLNKEKWRNGYWEQGYKFLTAKTDDWKYEEECRLISYSSIGEDVKLSKYNFDALEGIIFGIKTKDAHKMKILEIIEEKCRKSDKKDFKFYQAEYCHKNGKIEKKELILKLK